MGGERHAASEGEGAQKRPYVTRRAFLTGSGAVVATVGSGALVGGCRTQSEDVHGPAVHGPSVHPQAAAPAPGRRDALQFLNSDQAQALDAMVARLIPGDGDDPGAREAGVVFYIDHLLATHEGYAEKTYTNGPFAEAFEGDEAPDDADDVVWVPADELERYGWQSPFVPRELYEMGLARLDELARTRFDAAFSAIEEEEQQDELLAAMEDDEDDDVEEIFDDVSAGGFFELVRTHTIQGFLADPVYGGNTDMAGWRLVGFPGAQRSYSPEEMLTEGYERPPQSLLDLPPFHAHRDDDPDNALPTVRKRHPNGPID